MDQVLIKVINALDQAEAGIDYDEKYGAACPWCGRRLKTASTKGWVGSVRIRYHFCENEKCLFGSTSRSIKSLQEYKG